MDTIPDPVSGIPHSGKTRRPLVAYLEDDCQISDIVADFLGEWGLDAVIAADGNAMMAQLAAPNTVPPDVVITDFCLPGDNGATMIRRIRAAIGRDIPAILLSGLRIAPEMRPEIPANVTMLTKPVSMRTLHATLATLGIVPR